MKIKEITFTAGCDITAEIPTNEGEKPKLPTFSMKAYNGGIMEVAHAGAVAVDLSGMKIKDKTPILFGHDGKNASSILGQTTKITASNRLEASGQILGDSPTVRQVIALARNGYSFQASIGATIDSYEDVEDGDTAEINGQLLSGPFRKVTASTLREISIVPMGADSTTETAIAAEKANNNNQEDIMASKENIEAPTADHIRAEAVAEQSRILQVQAAAKDYPEIAAKAVKDGWDEAQTKAEVQAAYIVKLEKTIEADKQASERPPVTNISASVDPIDGVQVIEAAVALRAGIKNAEKVYDSETLNRAEDSKIHSITDMVKASCQLSGRRLESSRHETRDFLQAAFSTRSIANILSNLANKFILEGYGTVEDTWRRIANVRPVVDFKANTGSRLIMASLLKDLSPSGEIKHGSISDEARTVQADTKALMLGITRKDIVNDDLGAMTELPRRLGYAAARTFNVDFWAAFEAAVGANFSASAPKSNQQTGVLSLATLKTAEKLFMELTDADGNPLGTEATTMLVSPTNAAAARELFVATNLVGGTSKDPNVNIYAGMFAPAVTRYIAAAPWYLFASPMAVPAMEAAFLNGRQEPFVETADADFNTLGIQMRCYYDYGVAFAEWRSGVRSTGA